MSNKKSFFSKLKYIPKSIVEDNIIEEFVPYVSHYNKNSIITKNGELVSVIKIQDHNLSRENATDLAVNLRGEIIDFVANLKNKDDYAFWFTLIRKKIKLNSSNKFKNDFAKKINFCWNEENNFDQSYINEFYITIIHRGKNESILNFDNFLKSLSPGFIEKININFLKNSSENLSNICNDLLNRLELFNPEMLQIILSNELPYSELVNFFSYITNLKETNFPLSINDISNDFNQIEIEFGEREFKVKMNEDERYGAIISFKNFNMIDDDNFNAIINIDQELIFTQSIHHYYQVDKRFDDLSYQKYILNISKDEYLNHIVFKESLEEESKEEESKKYLSSQVSLTLISDTQEELDDKVSDMLEMCNNLSINLIREDMFMEHIYWSRLPANFSYLKRDQLSIAEEIVPFFSLSNPIFGVKKDDYWGEPLTIFKTALGTNLFFDLSSENNINLIIGNEKAPAEIISNFLVSQSNQFSPKIFAIDFKKKSKIIIESLGGDYFSFDDKEGGNHIKINPFSIANSDEEFLSDFLKSFLVENGVIVEDEGINYIDAIVKKVIRDNITDYKKVIKLFYNKKTINIYKKIIEAYRSAYHRLFCSDESYKLEKNINAFNIEFSELEDKKNHLPLLVYLLKLIEVSIDNEQPTFIIINNFWDMFHNEVTSKRIDGFLKKLTKKNVIVILATNEAENIFSDEFSKNVIANLSNIIFLPTNRNNINCEYLKLDADDKKILNMMSNENGHFLIKKYQEEYKNVSLIAFLKFKKYNQINKILNPNKEELAEYKKFRDENKDLTNIVDFYFK